MRKTGRGLLSITRRKKYVKDSSIGVRRRHQPPAILDAVDAGEITNAEISVVISNNPGAYALERARAKGVEAVCISPKDFGNREQFHQALLDKLRSEGVDLIVLAGFLVVIPEMLVRAYPNRIINVHPSLIPSFCGTGYLRAEGP